MMLAKSCTAFSKVWPLQHRRPPKVIEDIWVNHLGKVVMCSQSQQNIFKSFFTLTILMIATLDLLQLLLHFSAALIYRSNASQS